MHSMHALVVCSDHPEATIQQQQQQQLHQQQQHLQQQQIKQEDSANTMSVIESLDSSNSQVLGLLEPATVARGQQQQALVQQPPSHLVPQQQQQQHQLVQPAGGEPEPPQLHQLQPIHADHSTHLKSPATSQQQPHDEAARPHQQQQVGRHPGANLLRQRPQIEGIVAEGGGPIVQWLLDNYEVAEGQSLPRSTVYNHYLAHCRRLQMASVNAASFGKLIRSVFSGLKTRRLGTRGHSKYHYFGVRAKAHIREELLEHQEQVVPPRCPRRSNSLNNRNNNNDNSNQNTDNGTDSDGSADNHTGEPCDGRLSLGLINPGKRLKRTSVSGGNTGGGVSGAGRGRGQIYGRQPADQQQQELKEALRQHQMGEQLGDNGNINDNHVLYYTSNGTSNGYSTSATKAPPGASQSHHHQHHIEVRHAGVTTSSSGGMGTQCELVDFRNHLGANWSTLVDEHWPEREPFALERHLVRALGGGSNKLADLLEVFEERYKVYYKRMVELLSELKFLDVEQLWLEFWRDPPPLSADTTNPTQHQQHDVSPLGPVWAQMSPSSAGGAGPGGSGTSQSQNNGLPQQQPTVATSDMAHQQQRQQHMDYQHHIQQQQLTFHNLYLLTSQPAVIDWVNQIDYSLYAALETFLLPDLLSPIPSPLAQQIRLFAKNIGPWIELAVKDYGAQFVAEKSKSARAFGDGLRFYTKLNHLSTASRAVWEKRDSLAQMSMDLSRVDLRDIEHQVSLISHNSGSSDNNDQSLGHHLLSPPSDGANSNNNNRGGQNIISLATNNNELAVSGQQQQQQTLDSNNENSNNNVVIDPNQHHHHHHNHHQNQPHHHHQQQLCTMQPGQLIQNFLHLLEDPYPASSWPDWCRNLVELRVSGLSLEEARNFVLKWNFFISLVMKELTLRSAPSFGSFQLIRLLFDEYIFYLVVSRLAQAQHKTPAQLLSM